MLSPVLLLKLSHGDRNVVPRGYDRQERIKGLQTGLGPAPPWRAASFGLLLLFCLEGSFFPAFQIFDGWICRAT